MKKQELHDRGQKRLHRDCDCQTKSWKMSLCSPERRREKRIWGKKDGNTKHNKRLTEAWYGNTHRQNCVLMDVCTILHACLSEQQGCSDTTSRLRSAIHFLCWQSSHSSQELMETSASILLLDNWALHTFDDHIHLLISMLQIIPNNCRWPHPFPILIWSSSFSICVVLLFIFFSL